MDNAHRLPLVLTEGTEAKEISINAKDAQLLEARKFQVVDIARAFGVPPHMIGETIRQFGGRRRLRAAGPRLRDAHPAPHLVRLSRN
jgi:hypothetical protein